MSIEVKFDAKSLQKKMKIVFDTYRESGNLAMLKAGFLIHSISQKKYLNVVDGESRRIKGVRPDPRTTDEGLRRPTGNLAKNLLVGVYHGKNFTAVNGTTSSEIRSDIFVDSVAVGVPDTIKYATYQEQGAKDGIKRRDGRARYHAFLAPALRDAKPEIKSIFETELRSAQNKNKGIT